MLRRAAFANREILEARGLHSLNFNLMDAGSGRAAYQGANKRVKPGLGALQVNLHAFFIVQTQPASVFA